MTASSLFPNTWPVQHPERLQLYSMATPNGKKLGIALEELGLAYEAHRVDIHAGDQHDAGFRRLNPNGKIPCIIDPQGPGGKPIAMMESGAILLYLAEKTGKLLPTQQDARWEAVQWLFFQMASIGPMFGQMGHFYKFARDKTSDEYALQRYSTEAKRLLGVLEERLRGGDYIVADAFTLVDIATLPWVLALDFYGAKEHLGYKSFGHVEGWVQRCMARPAVQRGLKVCA